MADELKNRVEMAEDLENGMPKEQHEV